MPITKYWLSRLLCRSRRRLESCNSFHASSAQSMSTAVMAMRMDHT